jgi:hypothetical protein
MGDAGGDEERGEGGATDGEFRHRGDVTSATRFE